MQSEYDLAYLYYFGVGVEQNYEKAFEWVQKSAKQGYDQAQYNLGILYENGIGVEANYKKAREWYKKAAEQGHPRALKALAHSQK